MPLSSIIHRALVWAGVLLLTAICLPSASADPTSPAPTLVAMQSERAKPAEAFVNSIGINIKLEYQDTPYWDFNKLESVLKQSGIRHVRVALSGAPEIQAKMLKLHADGIGSTAIVAGDAIVPGDGPQTEFLKRLSVLAPCLDMLEGPNEADAGYRFDGKDFPASLDEYQHLLARALKGSPYSAIPLIAPSIGYPPNSAKVPNEPGDFGNTHSYHGARNPGTGEVNLDLRKFYLGNAALVSPGKPVICTETGNPTAAYADPSLWMPRISEEAQGKYAVRTFLEYFNAGIVRTFIHELIDEHPDPHHDEQNFGLLRNDWSPKPAFIGISNMISILRDPGPSFSCQTLSYALSGDTANIHHTLLQKRDGTFYLVLWKEAPSYDPSQFQDIGVADSSVQLHLAPTTFEGVYPYQPMSWPTPSALRLADASGTIALSIGDQPLIVQLLPAGADLVVTGAGVVGGVALAGHPVKMQAVVKNRGTAPTPPGLTLTVTFFDTTDAAPKMLTYSATHTDSLAPGQSVTLISDFEWTPGPAGRYSFSVLVDDQKRIPETSRANDTLAFDLDVK